MAPPSSCPCQPALGLNDTARAKGRLCSRLRGAKGRIAFGSEVFLNARHQRKLAKAPTPFIIPPKMPAWAAALACCASAVKAAACCCIRRLIDDALRPNSCVGQGALLRGGPQDIAGRTPRLRSRSRQLPPAPAPISSRTSLLLVLFDRRCLLLDLGILVRQIRGYVVFLSSRRKNPAQNTDH